MILLLLKQRFPKSEFSVYFYFDERVFPDAHSSGSYAFFRFTSLPISMITANTIRYQKFSILCPTRQA